MMNESVISLAYMDYFVQTNASCTNDVAEAIQR